MKQIGAIALSLVLLPIPAFAEEDPWLPLGNTSVSEIQIHQKYERSYKTFGKKLETIIKFVYSERFFRPQNSVARTLRLVRLNCNTKNTEVLEQTDYDSIGNQLARWKPTSSVLFQGSTPLKQKALDYVCSSDE